MTDYTTIDEACEALVHQDMDPIHKEKWVEALRSGNYVQITGGLKDTSPSSNAPVDGCIPDAYCCLGVAAEVILDHKLWCDATLYVFSSKELLERNGEGLLEALKAEDYEECDAYAASGASSYSGVEIPHSIGIHSHMAGLLATLNDDKRLTFEQIAEFAESKYFHLLNCYREDLPAIVKKDIAYLDVGGVADWVVKKMGWEDIEYQEEDERPDN